MCYPIWKASTSYLTNSRDRRTRYTIDTEPARLSGDVLLSQCSGPSRGTRVCARGSAGNHHHLPCEDSRPLHCAADVAEELLRSEGFTNIQYVEHSVNVYAGFTAGTIDISMAFIAPYIIQIDAGLPLVLLGGVHAGCFELFGTEPSTRTSCC